MRRQYPSQQPQLWFSMVLVRRDNQRADTNPEFQKELENILRKHSPNRNIIRYTDETRLATIEKEKEKIESQMTNPQRRTPKTHSPYKGEHFYVQTTTLEPKTLKVELLLEYEFTDLRQN